MNEYERARPDLSKAHLNPLDQAGAIVVDSVGKKCPQPIVDIARAAKGLTSGSRLVLVSDDPVTDIDLPAWCQMKRHIFLGVTGESPKTYLVEIGLIGEHGSTESGR